MNISCLLFGHKYLINIDKIYSDIVSINVKVILCSKCGNYRRIKLKEKINNG